LLGKELQGFQGPDLNRHTQTKNLTVSSLDSTPNRVREIQAALIRS
jgi:hypothetical protein